MSALQLEIELQAYVDELTKAKEETNATFSNNVDPRSNAYRKYMYKLKESSILIGRLLSRITDVKMAIRNIHEEIVANHSLREILRATVRAEVEAETILSKLEARLEYVTPAIQGKTNSEQASSDDTHEPDVDSATEQQIFVPRADISTSLLNLLEPRREPPSNTAMKTWPLRSGKYEPRKFELTRFFGARTAFPLFWNEFLDTVHKSPLEAKYKFAALRSLVRGEPYRLFLDLDYLSVEGYQKALKRLFDDYANDELVKRGYERCMQQAHTINAIPIKNLIETSTNPSKQWSDEYFTKKYANSVPHFAIPDRNLLLKAIQAFLNLYITGQTNVPNPEYIWLILLHGAKIQGKHIMHNLSTKVFAEDAILTDIPDTCEHTQEEYTLFLVKKSEHSKAKGNLTMWRYKGIDGEKTITAETMKTWYKYWWSTTQTDDEEKFQNCVNYFALLSMVLWRATIKEPESVEHYVAVRFRKIFSGFNTGSLVDMPDIVPPNTCAYNVVRKAFKRDHENFKTYLTYLVSCYAYVNTEQRKETRGFINAGCLQSFSSIGTGCIYWLRKYADKRNLKKEDLLMFFLIDPSMENQVKKMADFVTTYKRQITWWWARIFEYDQLKEISTAQCPVFAFACFVLNTITRREVEDGRKYAQFVRFFYASDPPCLTGENLGLVVKNMVIEWMSTPLSPLTKSLHRRYEEQKCIQYLPLEPLLIRARRKKVCLDEDGKENLIIRNV